jgi:type II secretory pathway component PulM
MASISAMFDQAMGKGAFALRPVWAQWNALEYGVRRLVAIGAALLATGFMVAFIWLPAQRTRDALTVRLPQLEALLADMHSQAKEVKALANAPARARTVADVTSLQSIFGADAQITAADGGFRIVIPAVAYASWWDKTGEALDRHALVLRSASINRVDRPGGNVIAVDMRLGDDARAVVLLPTPTRQDK